MAAALVIMSAADDFAPCAGCRAHAAFQPTPALSMASTSTSPTLASPVLERAEALDAAAAAADGDSPHFVSRMSTLPIVNTALRAYEQSKASSRVVKVSLSDFSLPCPSRTHCHPTMLIGLFLFVQYGAEMMESSVKTISRPVMDRLPVNQLDEFACRQLDRVRVSAFRLLRFHSFAHLSPVGSRVFLSIGLGGTVGAVSGPRTVGSDGGAGRPEWRAGAGELGVRVADTGRVDGARGFGRERLWLWLRLRRAGAERR